MSGSNGAGRAPNELISPETSGAANDALPRMGAAAYSLHGSGIFNADLGQPGVDASSRVFVSVSEVNPADRKPFLGGAVMTVHNVVPHDDGSVTIRVEVKDAPQDLPIKASLFYFNGF
ncbi:hypothetical protein ACIGJO_15270 [Streptomyces sp. NPDC079020]|uniref:hypothetical protein n=1 Tax=Streptomyces sp. NPDC079020 TaxID=3365722 RepID=UPI0037D163EF